MTRKRLGRFATLLTAAMTASMLIGAGTASAANPTWDIVITPTPTTVGAGHNAGFIVTVVNNGPSNINDMRVIVTPKDTPTAAPTYLSPLVYAIGGTANCISSVPLTCLLGSLEDDESVTFTVAYAVPSGMTGNFDLNVAIRAGTGDPDGKNNSRGDKYAEDSFAVIASGNFDGGFVVGSDTYQTNPTLGNRNVQSTALSGAPALIPVTIQDGITTNASCDSAADNAACDSLFGEWSELHVNNGNGGVPFGTAFKVTLVIRGSAVPGGTSAGDIQVAHVLDDGTVDVIGDTSDEICDSATAPTNAECILATKVGSNYQIVVWLFRNGSIRGGI